MTSPGATQPTFALDQSSPDVLAIVLRELDRIGEPRSAGRASINVKGSNCPVTRDQVLELRDTARRALQQAATSVRIAAEAALDGYRYQQQTNREHWAVAPVMHVFGGVRDPGPELNLRVKEVREATDTVRARLSASNLSGALTYLIRAEQASVAARNLWRQYHEGLISSSEGAVSALEFTRNASFITLGVLAIIATGGLGATTTVFGTKIGFATAATTANAIAFGAPVVARVAQTGMSAALGDQVDWTRVAVDTAVDVITARFGASLSQRLFQRLRGNPAVQRLGSNLFSRVMSSVIVHEGATAFREAVDAVYRRLRGQTVTWAQFEERLLSQLLDPRGLFIAALFGAVQTYADRRYGTPLDFVVAKKDGRPAGNPDEMRGGVLYEDKQARNLNVIPPGRTKPQQTPEEWARAQIYEATSRRLKNMPSEGVSTQKGSTPTATRNVPALSDVLSARRYVFRIEANESALRAAVEAQLARLRADFPDWTFSAVYGHQPQQR